MKNLSALLCVFLFASSGFAQKAALNFDGVNDYLPVTGTTKLNSLGKITLETWVYVTNFNSSPCNNCAPIIWNQNDGFRFGTGNTQKVYISIKNGSTVVTVTSSGTISANAWHHIAATFNGTKLKLYIDGVGTDSSTYTAFNINYTSTSSDVWVVDPNTGYGGTLDETRIWDYARSAAQIQEGMIRHYSSSEPGMVLQFSYEDGTPYADNTSVTKVKDKSSYGNDGTPGNFAMKDSSSNFVAGRIYCDTTAYGKFSVTRCVKYQLPSKKKFVSVSGVYQDTIVSWRGCDSVMTITVKILKTSSSSFTLAHCDSVQNPVTKEYYKKSGKYTTTIPNYVGCDSVITYFITVYPKDTTKISYNACDFVVVNGNTITKTGIYVDALKGFRGCDSIVIRDITINKSSSAKDTLGICRFVACPSTPTKIFRKAGIYYDTIPNSASCDSVIQYTVLSNSTSGTIKITSCGTYKSPSKKYTWTASGTYHDTLVYGNSKGCDSFMTINLTVVTPIPQTLNVAQCRSYTVPSGTKTVTVSSTVSDVIKSKGGCDSIQYTINVTINHANTNFTSDGTTLTASTTVSGATFKWLDCGNNFAAIPGETNKSFTPSKSGDYGVAVTENNCTDTSACYNFVLSGVNQFIPGDISISPNPTQGAIYIQSSTVLHKAKISIINTLGQTLKVWEIDNLTHVDLHADIPPGIHFIRIESAEGYMVKYMVFE